MVGIRIQRLMSDQPGVKSSYCMCFGEYACTEWDLVHRWWQVGFWFQKERLEDLRGCYSGGFPYWEFGFWFSFGKYRILPPFYIEFYRWGEPDEDGMCEKIYEFVWPPWEWQIDFPKWLDDIVYWWYHRHEKTIRRAKK